MQPAKYPWPEWTDGQLRHSDFGALDPIGLRRLRTALVVRASRKGLAVRTRTLQLPGDAKRLAFQFLPGGTQPDDPRWAPLFAPDPGRVKPPPNDVTGCRTCGDRHVVLHLAREVPCPACTNPDACPDCLDTLGVAGPQGIAPCSNPRHAPTRQPAIALPPTAPTRDSGDEAASPTPDDADVCDECGFATMHDPQCSRASIGLGAALGAGGPA